jgi:transcriptional regulator with XRE-family HTH domain
MCDVELIVMLNLMQHDGSLENYISMHRKSAGLSQDELALLLGLRSRSALAKYELAHRMPELQVIIGLEIVFGEPVQGVFKGVARRLRELIRARARALGEAMPEKSSTMNADKLRTLDRLAHLGDDETTIAW